MDHWSELFPLIFFPFKIIVLGVGMFFAIKWHVDQDNKKREEMRERNQIAQADLSQADVKAEHS